MALQYESNTDLAFNTDVLRDCGNKYGNIAGELRSYASQLDSLLSDLASSGWTTPAGLAFAEMAKTNWSQDIEKYADILEHLNTLLTESAGMYEGLADDISRIDLSI